MVILLTACVKPNGMSFTCLQDEQIRYNQYREALEWYLHNTTFPIVVVENTNTDYTTGLEKYVSGGRLEVIIFDGNNFDKSLGKGYGEGIILKTALERSLLIRQSKSVIKITGRLIFKNINRVVKSLSDEIVYSKTRLYSGRCMSDSFIFVAPIDFLKSYFLPNIDRINDTRGDYFEHILFAAIQEWQKDGNRHREFKYPLKVQGLSGSTGEPYYRKSHFSNLKALIRYHLHNKGFYYNYK